MSKRLPANGALNVGTESDGDKKWNLSLKFYFTKKNSMAEFVEILPHTLNSMISMIFQTWAKRTLPRVGPLVVPGLFLFSFIQSKRKPSFTIRRQKW